MFLTSRACPVGSRIFRSGVEKENQRYGCASHEHWPDEGSPVDGQARCRESMQGDSLMGPCSLKGPGVFTATLKETEQQPGR